jgi:hypothetical protein
MMIFLIDSIFKNRKAVIFINLNKSIQLGSDANCNFSFCRCWKLGDKLVRYEHSY